MSLTPKRLRKGDQQGEIVTKFALQKELQLKAHRKILWTTWTTLVSTLLGALVSLITTEVALTSVVNSIHIRSSYAWFIGGILLFQTILMLIVWQIRKRNRQVIELKQRLIDVYLTSLNNSRLNPNRQSSEQLG